jgi:DNA polymerase-3 subunit delta'
MPSYRKSGEAEKVRRSILDEMAVDPFHIVQFEKAHSIGIDIIREVKAQTYMKPVEAGYKVIILSRAEKMTEEASNSLLKVLEEPPEDVVLFLTAAKPDWLLSTIVSRCREVQFSPLSQETVARLLIERGEVEPEQALLAAALSRGSISAALIHGEEDLAAWRDRALALFDAGRPGADAELHARAQELLSEGGRAAVVRAVEIMRIWTRDLLLARCDSKGAQIANVDLRDRLMKEAESLTVDDILHRARVLEDMTELVDGNVNPSLILFSGVLRYFDPSLKPEAIAGSFPRSLFDG